MRVFVTSDVHADIWMQDVTGKVEFPPETEREAFYDKWLLGKFLPADACIIAGDIGNDSTIQIEFLRYIATKYDTVYTVFGNHDLVVNEYEHIYKTSEERIAAIKRAFAGTNVHVLDGNAEAGIAGCMGFCDFSVMAHPVGIRNTPYYRWKKWFDGTMWNYMGQRPKRIRYHFNRMLSRICKSKPRVVVTHYPPVQMGIPFDYRNSSTNTFFFFDGTKYLDMLDDGAIWVCGHCHERAKTIYTNSSGAHITIMCNPIGYPFTGHMFEYFDRKDFYIDL